MDASAGCFLVVGRLVATRGVLVVVVVVGVLVVVVVEQRKWPSFVQQHELVPQWGGGFVVGRG